MARKQQGWLTEENCSIFNLHLSSSLSQQWGEDSILSSLLFYKKEKTAQLGELIRLGWLIDFSQFELFMNNFWASDFFRPPESVTWPVPDSTGWTGWSDLIIISLMAHVTLLPLKFGTNLVLAFKMKNKIAKRVSLFIICKQRPPPSPAPFATIVQLLRPQQPHPSTLLPSPPHPPKWPRPLPLPFMLRSPHHSLFQIAGSLFLAPSAPYLFHVTLREVVDPLFSTRKIHQRPHTASIAMCTDLISLTYPTCK